MTSSKGATRREERRKSTIKRGNRANGQRKGNACSFDGLGIAVLSGLTSLGSERRFFVLHDGRLEKGA